MSEHPSIDAPAFEVYRREQGGWAVRRGGEADDLSHHPSREQAEKAARLHSDEAIGVDLRQDIFVNDPEQARRPAYALIPTPTALIAAAIVVALIAVVVALG